MMEVTKSPKAVTKARLAPARSAGLRSGSVTRRSVRARPAPRLAAASSKEGSSARTPAAIARLVMGRFRTRYASGRIQSVPTRMNRPASGSRTLNAVARAMANTVPGTAQGSARSPAIARRGAVVRRAARSEPASAIATAATVATVASQMLFTSGRNRTGSCTRVT
jgi:hypothetical protein